MPGFDRTHDSSLAGRAAMMAVTVASVFAMRALLLGGVGARLLNIVGLQAYTPPASIAFWLQVFIIVRAARQIIWVLFFVVTVLPVGAGVMIGIFNTFMDTIAVLSALRVKSEPPTALLLASIALFFAGIAIELGSETQRLLFKRDPRNQGKPYMGGLFSASVHANYFGYTLWRIGLFLVSQALLGIPFTAYLLYDFFHAAMPDKEQYCLKRYGKDYQDYLRRTARFIPYVF